MVYNEVDTLRQVERPSTRPRGHYNTDWASDPNSPIMVLPTKIPQYELLSEIIPALGTELQLITPRKTKGSNMPLSRDGPSCP